MQHARRRYLDPALGRDKSELVTPELTMSFQLGPISVVCVLCDPGRHGVDVVRINGE